MMNNTWIMLVLGGFVVVVVILGVMMFLSSSKKSDDDDKKPQKAKSLEELIREASSANAKNLDLLIKAFLATQKFPFRDGTKISADAKKKLDFITAVASNSNATPKHISFLNRELNKKYGSYKKEIDAYEQMGVAKRNIREKKK